MHSHSENLFNILLEKVWPVALTFVDDLLMLVLSNLGLQVPGLQWLSPLLMAFTLGYWLSQFLRHHSWFQGWFQAKS
ncbi:hypothetical protein [Leptolyngbya sp. FACHB-261]|uniref:hypothetical protein n=1 Tax=Leptolyngbya sp. FACHB-261 TaxID=2692806 RepID=UPI001684FD88|nr:hypothetical protein [Leptolyngbya sp. FACHB-261]MBD2104818.1 hypothetical protein [Leptolyngbya sp. FACHB-261]